MIQESGNKRIAFPLAGNKNARIEAATIRAPHLEIAMPAPAENAFSIDEPDDDSDRASRPRTRTGANHDQRRRPRESEAEDRPRPHRLRTPPLAPLSAGMIAEGLGLLFFVIFFAVGLSSFAELRMFYKGLPLCFVVSFVSRGFIAGWIVADCSRRVPQTSPAWALIVALLGVWTTLVYLYYRDKLKTD